jgi:hypothetical protein
MTYDHLIARTGRVQSWLDDSTSRLPVSCTVFVPEDGMEGQEGIEASWKFVSYALRHGAGVAVHLSKLRPKGDENGKGLVASGPVSFAKVYSVLNEILRRGGVYKNGAVTLHLDLDHPDILEFLNISRGEIPWAKRCVDLTSMSWENAPQYLRQILIKKIKSGDIWLNKIRHDWMGKRLYGNVCLEVYLPSRGTCLLQHVNLGACRIEDLKGAFVYGMTQLCELHPKTEVGKGDSEYLPPTVDRQVSLGMLGLANLLSIEKVTYRQLADAFDGAASSADLGYLESVDPELITAYSIAFALEEGISEAAKVARRYQMDRAFGIAPTASCSYRYKDRRGFTTCPEIAPPISREVDRDSGTFGVESFNYGPVETASEVGWEDFYRVANHIVRLLRSTGLFHGYSMNTWSDAMTVDENFIEDWLVGPQTSIYYSLQVQPDTQDKTNVMAALGDPEETEDFLAEILSRAKEGPACDCAE